jgi:hypothetical protein
MLARKSNPASAAYDVFECLACDTELRLAAMPPHSGARPKKA